LKGDDNRPMIRPLPRLHDTLASYVFREEVPGAAWFIARHGEVSTGTVGDYQPDTIYRISSMTKPDGTPRSASPARSRRLAPAPRRAAADPPAERALDVQHRLGHPRRSHRTRRRQPFETFLRERVFTPLGMTDTAFAVPLTQSRRLPAQLLPDSRVFDLPNGRWMSPPAFPSGAGGLASTVNDYGAFAGMLRGAGAYGGERILSRASVSLMTSDRLTPEVKAVSGLTPGEFDTMGWGFGVSVTTRRTDLGPYAGSYGWSGGLGTTWFNDPAEDLIAILMTQKMWSSPRPPAIVRDFVTCTYQSLE
jgi:CubicO group peptidase (beta-lactamase class C family)